MALPSSVKQQNLHATIMSDINVIKERVANQSNIPVGGRLRFFHTQWKRIGAPKSVMRWLRRGYPLPFQKIQGQAPEITLTERSPPGLITKYARGSDKQCALDLKVKELLAKNAIQEMPPGEKGFFNRVFLRAKSSGGFRLILDVSELNKHLICPTFKMDTTKVVRQAVKVGQWATSIDFSDAYHHVPMRRAHWKYLCFEVGGRRYWYCSLPFGLNTAPRIFTEVLKTLKEWARLLLMLLFHYIDDWLNVASSFQRTWVLTRLFVHKCLDLGLLINLKKSELVPTQRILFLGRVFDFVQGRVFLSPDCRKSVASKIAKTSLFARPPLWLAESLLGVLSSAEKAVPWGRLNLRDLQRCVNQALRRGRTSFRTISMTAQAWQNLAWWSLDQNLTPGQLFRTPPASVEVQSDSSTTGWGFVLNNQTFQGTWSVKERKLHINVLELRVIAIVCRLCPDQIRGRTVRFLLDNSTAVAYVNKQGGTRSLFMLKETRRVLTALIELNVTPVACHIAGALNVLADLASRQGQVITTEWRLSDEVFQWIGVASPWGPPQVELFANSSNRHLKLYLSPCPDAQSIGVDALVAPWPDQVLYAFPPAVILDKVVARLLVEKRRRVLLVAPWLPNAPWFPSLNSLLLQEPSPLPTPPGMLQQPHWAHVHPTPEGMKLHLWLIKTRG